MFKVIVAGGRDFNDYELLRNKLDFLLQDKEKSAVEIVSGTANGADKLGERYAFANSIQVKCFPANWEAFGRSAGYKRNKQMAEYADALVAFWDGKSKGTEHMINLAEEYNLQIRVIEFK